MQNRTKIICTIGPSVDTVEKMLELIDSGMNGARLNFSHGTHEEHGRVIANLKKAREKAGVPLCIILDTKGPEIRIGTIEGGEVSLKAGSHLKLSKEPSRGLVVHPKEVIDDIPVGATLLIDDGYIISKVIGKTPDYIEIEIFNDGVIKTGKKINVPGVHVSLPAMTEEDIRDIEFGCIHDVDMIAASFIRSKDHILQIKQLLKKLGKPDILVWAKIENSLGVENFDEIVAVSDGIMVARGDLGVELELQQVPVLQKMMIRKCYQSCKPVTTATQMLESMIHCPRPTRAEVSDVANAIYDSSSSIMLSGETAVGKYPMQTVCMMKKIAIEAEKDFDYREFFYRASKEDFHDVSSSIALAAVKTAYSAPAKAIFVITSSGTSARELSRFRPQMPVFAFTDNLKTYHQLALDWGVIVAPAKKVETLQEAIHHLGNFALEKGLLQAHDMVTIMAGVPFGIQESSNIMMVQPLSDVILSHNL